MQNSNQLKGYIDDYGKVVVEIYRSFYNGHADWFYITNDSDYYVDCFIEKVIEEDDKIIYMLKTPELNLGKEYIIGENHGARAVLKYRFITKTKRFDCETYYDGNDLGAIYHKTYTSFKIWAPTAVLVTLKLIYGDKVQYVNMDRNKKGVYWADVKGDLKNALYLYFVRVNGEMYQTIDPYGFSSIANGSMSAVIDFEEIEKVVSDKNCSPLNNYCDAIIYETSVRDVTSLYNSGTNTHGYYESLCEDNTQYNGYSTGLNYIKSLGVTHVQLMPVLDFATVNECAPKRNYNWGYDPLQYFTLEGSYSLYPNDPYCRVKEFSKLVSTLHRNGIRVVLDVVYNHMYDMTQASLNKVVPYYYFRFREDHTISNGSWCGNDLDSTMKMTHKLILDSLRFFMTQYKIDGFRFDLMGILDSDLMNDISVMAKMINKNVILYGEGWNMDTALPYEKKAIIANSDKMPDIGMYNDFFRDVVKGKTSDSERFDKGFLCGNMILQEKFKSAMTGNCLENDHMFSKPSNSVNYAECHDNSTCWDKLKDCCIGDSHDVREDKQKLILAAVLFAQGVPFIHSGEEFCRSKHHHPDTFNMPDAINGLDWARRGQYDHIVNFTRDCITLRKRYPEFRMRTANEIRKHLSFHDNEAVVEMHLTGEHDLSVYFNPMGSYKTYHYDYPVEVIFAKNGLVESEETYEFTVEPYSVLIIERK